MGRKEERRETGRGEKEMGQREKSTHGIFQKKKLILYFFEKELNEIKIKEIANKIQKFKDTL